MRMRAVQNLGHEHALQLDIRREGRFPLRELDRIDFLLRFADYLPCLCLRCYNHLGPRTVCR